MKKTLTWMVAVTALVFCLSFVSMAQCSQASVTNPVLTTGVLGSAFPMLDPTNGTATQAFSFAVTPGHAYSIIVGDDSQYYQASAPPTIQYYSDSTCNNLLSVTPTTAVDPAASAIWTSAPTNASRVSFIASPTTHTVTVLASNPDTSTPVDILVSVTESTMINTRWSTYSNVITTWGFTNTTGQQITGVFTVFDASNTVVKTSTITIPTNGAAFATTGPYNPATPNIIGLNIAANNYGYALFAPLAPPGAVMTDAFFNYPWGPVPVVFQPVSRNY